VIKTLEAEAPEETALYRVFGVADFLLYIGISNDFGRRWKEHAKEQPWWDQKRRLTVDEWFPFRSEAEAAEKAAIKAEHPKYNKMHAANRPPRRAPGCVTRVAIVHAVPRSMATTDEVAAYLKMPARKLGDLRRQDAGPFCRFIGRTPRYHWEDVEEWLTEHPETERQAPARPHRQAARRAVRPAARGSGAQGNGLPQLRALVLDALEDSMIAREVAA
jgi:hypothetical protein